MQLHRGSQFVLCLLPCSPVKLRDFESAVNNFEKALERAKLVHNNEAQQAIISVSLFTCWAGGMWLGSGWLGPQLPLAFPKGLLPTCHRTHAGRVLVLAFTTTVHLYSSRSEWFYLKQKNKTLTKHIHLFHVLCTLTLTIIFLYIIN